MTLNWELFSYGIWNIPSVLSDIDGPFYYEISVTQEGLFSIEGTAEELLPKNYIKTFQTLEAAKKYCELLEAFMVLSYFLVGTQKEC